ncbi:hypothetical protein PUN28_006556 [Cardiocondyla obscurior]|uniref:Secreted protein n=1 Tax=Cardiocondyla obscurior TaxID=286306 RepID=A0AAW2GAV7_9HYME
MKNVYLKMHILILQCHFVAQSRSYYPNVKSASSRTTPRRAPRRGHRIGFPSREKVNAVRRERCIAKSNGSFLEKQKKKKGIARD